MILFQVVPMYSRCWVAPVYVYPVLLVFTHIHSHPRRRRSIKPRHADQSFAFQAARSADSSGFSRPSQNSGQSWNHFSLLQVE